MLDSYRFILADDHPLFRKALKKIIESFTAVQKVFEAGDGLQVLQILAIEKIDVVFLDYSMPGLNGYDTAKTIASKYPQVNIIILTQYDEIPVILNFFKIGAKGFLTKNADEHELKEAIESVLTGNLYFHSRFDESIKKWLGDGLIRKIPAIKFSERDLALMILLSKGKTSVEISQNLGLTPRSVETYRSRLLKSLNIKNTIELLHYLYKNGIL